MENKISVNFCKYKKMWRLRIRGASGANHHIGHYNSEEEAYNEGFKLKEVLDNGKTKEA